MFKTMSRFRDWQKRHTNERGDVVQTIFMLPIAIFLLFALINLSSYFSIRAQIQDTARSGARLVALYGGSGTGAVLNKSGQTVESKILGALWDGSKCTISYCAQKPEVTCSPTITKVAGELVTCNIKYYYSPIAPVPAGLEGLNGVTGQPMSVTSTYVAETGKKG
jgi:hypothetical protein